MNNDISSDSKYKPNSIDELCMNPRKLKDVKQILFNDMLIENKYKILVLTGPSGSCKTTMLKLLIKQYYKENKNLFQNFTITNNNNTSSYNENNCIIEYDPLDKSIKFKDFLNNCKIFKKNTSLMKFIVIKHLPNIYYDKIHTEFINCINEWLDDGFNDLLPPLILIISECDIPKSVTEDITRNNTFNKFDINNHYIPETIFNKEILLHPKLKRVNVNKIAKTYLKKQLMKILKDELQTNSKVKLQSVKKYDSLIDKLSEIGDLPSAIIQLQQYIQTPFLLSDHLTNDTNKDTGLSIFHAMGKIIYGTKEENVFNEDIIDKLCKDYQQYTDSIFKMSLLENIDIGCYDLKKFSEIVNTFSETDLMDNTLGTEVYLRKIRQSMDVKGNSNKKTISGLKFTPFFKVYKKRQHSYKEYRDFQSLDGLVTENFKILKDIILWSGYHDPIIKKFYYNKYKAWKEYKLSLGESILNYNGMGSDFDPDITYLNKLGGEYGSITSVNEIELQDNNDYFFSSKYYTYLNKYNNKNKNKSIDIEDNEMPYDPNVDDFEIEESANDSSSNSNSTDDDDELFQLTSQQIQKVQQSNITKSKSKKLQKDKNEKKVNLSVSSDSYDSDEELFQLTSQHIQNMNKSKI